MKIYGIKSCDSCKKAIKSLESAGYHVLFHDIRANPLENKTLAEFLNSFGEDLKNTRSTTWRNLSEEERSRPTLELLVEYPTLMKRPVIEADELHLGWGASVQKALL